MVTEPCYRGDALLTFHQLLPKECLQICHVVSLWAKALRMRQEEEALHLGGAEFDGNQDPPRQECQKDQRILGWLQPVLPSQLTNFE
jgi:hypothetical protein